MTRLIILTLSIYKKFLSPLLTSLFGNACRFTPTCSDYSIQAFEKYGLIKGLTVSVRRIAKCHPFGDSGYDPIGN